MLKSLYLTAGGVTAVPKSGSLRFSGGGEQQPPVIYSWCVKCCTGRKSSNTAPG